MRTTQNLKFTKANGDVSALYLTKDSGRIIYRDKIDSLIGIKHPGIFLGTDKWGTEWVAHNHYKNRKVEIVTYKEFALGERVFYDMRPVRYNTEQIVSRAISSWMSNLKYNWLSENCQHFVSSVTENKRKSESINEITEVVSLTGGLTFLAGLITGDRTLINVGGIALGTGLLGKSLSQ